MAGFLYQVTTAAIAWVSLWPDEDLHLEVAEDFAVAAQDALHGVQVKHTSESVTTNSPSVLETINSLFDLQARNPDRIVTIRYLTTSAIGMERNENHRVRGVAGLTYWREAAGPAVPLQPLRDRLLAMPLGSLAHDFLREACDERVREDLLRRIDWVTEALGQEEQRRRLDQLLIEHGYTFGVSPSASSGTVGAILTQVFERSASATPEDRRLNRADFLELFEGLTHVSLPRGALTAFASTFGTSYDGMPVARPSALSLAAVPTFPELPDRQAPLTAVIESLAQGGGAWLVGATGHGKSTLAMRAAKLVGGPWGTLRLRGLGPSDTITQLRRAGAEATVQGIAGAVLDDVEHIHDAAVAGALAETIQLLTRKGAKILLTGSSRPNLTMLRSCGLATNACIELGALSEAEIEQLVALLGGNPNDWGRYIHIASSGGHPQLAHALALGLAERGWPESEFRSLAALLGHDAATREVLDDTRRRIMGEIPEGARDLLYRLSLLIGVFDRQTVLALARPSPPVARPGEAFDRLLGPWIERVGNDEFRASPLIRGSAEAMLPKEEITALHAAAARDHTARKSLRADKLDPIFTYALLGREERSLTLAAFAVLSAPHADLQMLAESSTVFCHYTSLTGQFPNPTPLHAIVRSAQLLLLAASGQTEKLRTAWGLFHEELSAIPHETFSDSEVKGADSLHLYVLWKLLGLEGAIEVLTDLPDACLVFGDLMAVSPIALDDLPAASADAPIGNRAAAFFFQLQLGQAKSVAALIRTFEALKRRTEAERMTLLATLPAEFINDELAVRGPWMTLFKKGERGTESLAQEYLRLAELLDRQEEVGFMLGAVETAAIILDEDLGKGAAALAVVEGALARHPGNVRLLRALSRIHFHAHRYPEQLAIGMRLEEAVEFGAIELAHFQRELAVGLANLGQNEEAARLFERAARNAGAVALPSMANMAAGLLADAAVQHVFAGRGPAVLALLAEALPLIDTRRTNNEFDDVALRKLFGHTVVWARMELFGTKGGTGELRLSMVAGANSNSAKHQDLLTTKSGPVEVLWYMLADLEALLGVDHGIGRAIDKPNWDARALFELELSRPVTQLRAAIRNENGQLIGEALARVIDVEAALSTLDGARPIGDDFNFSRGRVPILSEVAFAAVRHNYTVYPLAVFIRMSLRGNAAEASILLQTIASASRPVFSPEQVGNIRDLSKARPIEDFLSVALSVAQSVENSSVPAIDQLFLITLRLVENDNNPIAGEVVSHAADWLERSWREALNRQSFRLKNPQLARPLVEAALATTRPPCSRFAKLLLVIEPYLSVRLSRELRDRVQANAAD